MFTAQILGAETAAEKQAISAANYLASQGEKAPAIKTAKALVQLATLAAAAGKAAQAKADGFSHGAQAMAVVAGLVACRSVEACEGMAWRGVSNYLKGEGLKLAADDASNKVAFSEAGRVFKALVSSFAPAAAHDVAQTTVEAMDTVRKALSDAGGTFRALRDASPTASNAGRKGPAEKAEKQGEDESEVTSFEAAKTVRLMLAALVKLAGQGDTEASDELAKLAKEANDAAAKVRQPKAKKAPKVQSQAIAA